MTAQERITAQEGRKIAKALGLKRARLNNDGWPLKDERYRLGEAYGLKTPVGVFQVIQRLATESAASVIEQATTVPQEERTGSTWLYERGDAVETPLGVGTIHTTPDDHGNCKVKLTRNRQIISATTFQFGRIICKFNVPAKHHQARIRRSHDQ